jgi:23S rRNA (guanosine2251-2'-O)-methyltransferase
MVPSFSEGFEVAMQNLIIGRHPVLESLRSENPPEKIYILFGTRGAAIQQIQQVAKRQGVLVKEVDRQRFLELSSDPNTQGVVALVATKQYVDIEGLLQVAAEKHEPPFLLILDEIEDPHNVGALIRTAECAGVHGVVLPKHHAASLNETVAKASAGASLHLPAAKVTNIANTLDELRSKGVWIVGTDMQAEKAFDEMDYRGAIAIVVGNEGKGIRRLVKEKCDFLVKIPMFGTIGSLNASVAGGLVLFAAARSRHSSQINEGTK